MSQSDTFFLLFTGHISLISHYILHQSVSNCYFYDSNRSISRRRVLFSLLNLLTYFSYQTNLLFSIVTSLYPNSNSLRYTDLSLLCSLFNSTFYIHIIYILIYFVLIMINNFLSIRNKFIVNQYKLRIVQYVF